MNVLLVFPKDQIFLNLNFMDQPALNLDLRLNKILIVDDDEIHNFITVHLIEKLNITERLKVIKNGLDALKFIEERCMQKTEGICPDLVFLDYKMPLLNGHDVLRQIYIRGINTHGHIIFFIFSATEIRDEIKAELILFGVKEFFTKPLKEHSIRDLIEKHLR